MSRQELKKTIERQLKELNWKIDMKIIHGLSYRQEARRHKILLRQLEHLKRSEAGIFDKIFGTFAY